MSPLKRSLLIFAALCAASLTSAQAAQPSVDPEFAADVVDRYANHIYYGSGGVYSTPGDMMRWMQQFLSSDFFTRGQQADRMQTLIYQRSQLTRVIGMDVPGKADALGLGWVYMKPKNGQPGIIQKTGGGGGFITYMAMNPQANVGAFVVVTRSSLTRFNNMSDGINELVSELSGVRPVMETASQ